MGPPVLAERGAGTLRRGPALSTEASVDGPHGRSGRVPAARGQAREDVAVFALEAVDERAGGVRDGAGALEHAPGVGLDLDVQLVGAPRARGARARARAGGRRARASCRGRRRRGEVDGDVEVAAPFARREPGRAGPRPARARARGGRRRATSAPPAARPVTWCRKTRLVEREQRARARRRRRPDRRARARSRTAACRAARPRPWRRPRRLPRPRTRPPRGRRRGTCRGGARAAARRSRFLLRERDPRQRASSARVVAVRARLGLEREHGAPAALAPRGARGRPRARLRLAGEVGVAVGDARGVHAGVRADREVPPAPAALRRARAASSRHARGVLERARDRPRWARTRPP